MRCGRQISGTCRKTFNKMVPEAQTTCEEGVENRKLTVFETMVLYMVQNILATPEIVSCSFFVHHH